MKTKIIEATNAECGGINFGKFLLGCFDSEWSRKSIVDNEGSIRLLHRCGWTRERTILVLDLQTGEGGVFCPPGLASADLDKHRIWVCPMFEPFLAWLYLQDLSDLDKLPDHVDLDAMSFMFGHRRRGPPEWQPMSTCPKEKGVRYTLSCGRKVVLAYWTGEDWSIQNLEPLFWMDAPVIVGKKPAEETTK